MSNWDVAAIVILVSMGYLFRYAQEQLKIRTLGGKCRKCGVRWRHMMNCPNFWQR